MAIRSTNANRRGGTADDLARDMQAAKGNEGKGNAKDGYPNGSTTPGYIDYRNPANNGPFYKGTTRQEYRDDPNARLIHSPGSSRGQQSNYKPSVSPKTPWVEPTAEWYAQDNAAQAQRRSEREEQEAQIPGYAEAKAAWEAAKASGDRRATSAALKRALDIRTKGTLKIKDQRALDAFIAQGGTEETYRNRFNRDWPKPRSPLGAYSHGPGSADWDTRFTNPVPPNTAGGGRSGGGGNDAANRPSSGRELNEWLRDHPSGDSLPGWAVDPGFSKSPRMGGGRGGMIEGYLGSGGMTEDLPPGASFDMPSNNILSALKPLSDNLWNGNKPTGSGTASSAKKPTVVRRGGGRVESR